MDLWGQQCNTVQNDILSLGIAYICSRFPNSVLCCLFTMCSHCCYAVKRHSADWYELWAWTDKRSYIAGHICKLFPSVHSLKKAITLERVAQMTWFLAQFPKLKSKTTPFPNTIDFCQPLPRFLPPPPGPRGVVNSSPLFCSEEK